MQGFKKSVNIPGEAMKNIISGQDMYVCVSCTNHYLSDGGQIVNFETQYPHLLNKENIDSLFICFNSKINKK
jgi:hypothetical protein